MVTSSQAATTGFTSTVVQASTTKHSDNDYKFYTAESSTETVMELDGVGQLTVRSAHDSTPVTTYQRSRITTGTAQTVVDGDTIHQFDYSAYSGGTPIVAARIAAIVDEDDVASTTKMGGRLLFATTADGGSSPTTRMTIENTGNVDINELTLYPDGQIAADNTLDLDGQTVTMDSSTNAVTITGQTNVVLSATTGKVDVDATTSVELTSTTTAVLESKDVVCPCWLIGGAVAWHSCVC